MKPLLFLTIRSIVNGIRRALTTPRRLFSFIIIVAYYFFFFIRPYAGSSSRFGPRPEAQLPFPPLDLLQAVIFGIFVLLSLMAMMGMFSVKGGFKAADVDVLFPTPISPKIVLVFRIFRDYLATLLAPLLITILAFRPAAEGWSALFRNMPHPEYSGMVMRAGLISWLLIALVWVSISYALSLFINRSDVASDRNKKVIYVTIGALLAGVLAYIGWSLSQIGSASDAIALTNDLTLRVFFFTATLGTQTVMAPITGNWWLALSGLGGMLLIIWAAFSLALTQAHWMYDQAAARGFGASETKKLQQAGDMYGLLSAAAREGKIKAGRRTFAHSLKMQGPLALLWKEIFLQSRGTKLMILAFFAITLFMNAMPALIPADELDMAVELLFLFMQGMTILIVTLSLAQTGFIEMLRRVDLQKPLPFRPATTVLVEVFGKGAAGVIAAWAGAILVFALRPDLWSVVLAALILAPFVSALVSVAAFSVTMLFPDVDDPSQRGIRNLLMLLSIMILAIMPGAAYGLQVYLFQIPSAVAALPTTVVILGEALVLAFLSGELYASYNPSE